MAREIAEETQCAVLVGPILDSWMYYIEAARKHVFIVTYGCHADDDNEPVLSHEHQEIGQFTEDQISGRRMPNGYKRSIMAWYGHLRALPR